MANEHVSVEDIHNAYFSCLVNKRNKNSAVEYSHDYEINNHVLRNELNSDAYEIGKSICFCVTRPKLREVFAASFRDRIVHHLLMMKFLHFFEERFIPSSYSCRVGKGVLYGVHDMQRQIAEIGKDCWFVKLDMEGFFMSIDKRLLADMVETLFRERWDSKVDGDDKEWWVGLFRKVIMHRPEKHCEKHGNPHLFEQLPPHKSLFKSNGYGLPIGNLTSQILANYYLSGIDSWLYEELQGYGRYVDDLVFLGTDIGRMKRMINRLRYRLKGLNLRLNEGKTIIQRADKGLLFTGYVIKPWGLYAGHRLVTSAFKASYNETDSVARHLNRINSYYGFLQHTLSYNIRKDIWRNVSERYDRFRVNPSMTKLIRTDLCKPLKYEFDIEDDFDEPFGDADNFEDYCDRLALFMDLDDELNGVYGQSKIRVMPDLTKLNIRI